MGLLDSIFGGDKPSTKSIEKLVSRVKEGYAQPEYRREAMDKLLAWGTPEAYAGVLKRFTIVIQSPHWDEEEKRWLCDELATRGEPAREAVKAYLAREDNVAFAAKTLAKLSPSKDAWITDIVTALQARPPEDHRTSKGKAELINQLRDGATSVVIGPVLAYVDDHADDVQLSAWDCCEHFFPEASEDDGAAMKTRAKAVIADDGRSARVLRHVGGIMSRLKFPVDPSLPLPPSVAEDFVVRDGTLVSSR